VTIGLAVIGSFPWAQVPGYIAAQLVGAFLGAALVWLSYLPHWAATEDKESKLGIFATVPAIRHLPGNILAEVIGTAVLVFGVLAIGANAEGLTKPGEIDLSVAFQQRAAAAPGSSAGLGHRPVAGRTDRLRHQSARDLGPRFAHALLPISGKGDSDWGYSWVPIVAPIFGGALGAVLFRATGI